jgi:hypothetical protein
MPAVMQTAQDVLAVRSAGARPAVARMDLLDLLHERGWILNPKGKVKSVVLTEAGHQLAGQVFTKHFGKSEKS